MTPESAGLEAIAAGSMMIATDDHEAIEKQAYIYDALYAYCKLRILKEKYADVLEKLDREQKLEFLRNKVKENIL